MQGLKSSQDTSFFLQTFMFDFPGYCIGLGCLFPFFHSGVRLSVWVPSLRRAFVFETIVWRGMDHDVGKHDLFEVFGFILKITFYR